MATQSRESKLERKRKISSIIRYSILIGVCIFMLYPLVWLFTATFKPNNEIFGTTGIWPKEGFSAFTDWSHWKNGWYLAGGETIGFHFMNTMKFLIPRVIGTVLSSVITAYAVARMSFKGKKLVFTIIIATLLMPAVIFRIPLYMMYNDLGWINTFKPLWVETFFATQSFFIFMLIQFFRTIPRELDEAAIVDGCNSFKTLIYILVPLLKPIIITVAVLTFMWGLNDFMGPLIYIQTPDKRPLSVALKIATDAESTIPYAQVYATSFMALLPPIILFSFAQRFFIEGIATTGSKG